VPNKDPYPDKMLAGLVDAWQAGGDGDALAILWGAAAPIVHKVARVTLAKSNIRDPAAVDDAVSLVMDYLRRLPSGAVAKYDCERSAANYLKWLATNRSRDVSRSRRRLREKPWLGLPEIPAPSNKAGDANEATVCNEFVAALHQAIAKLDGRAQEVIKRHLAGERRARTASDLGVCEGTVTRIRQRAMAQLQAALLEKDRGPRPRQPR
jgi:RNA polymerase sigma factor (sigma-70 family)